MSASKGQQTIRSVLVAGQMAVALTLLVSAGLMVRSWSKLRAVDPGFEAEGLLTLELRLPFQTYESWDRTYTFHRTLIDRVRDLPRVTGAASSTVLPLAGPGPCASMFVENRPQSATEEPPCISYRLASPGWFEVMGIGVTGRTPGWEDVVGGSGAIVVTGAAARMLWPRGNAIGGGTKSNGDQPPFYRVSAVTEDIHGDGLDAPPSAEVYFPLMPMPGAQLWSPPTSFTLAVRTVGADPMAVLPEIRAIVADLDADVPIANARPMETVVSQSMARTSFTLLLLVVAAGTALVLCIVGMYGLIAYVVGQRRAEIGIRMALGARTAQVVRTVVVRSLMLAGAGIGVGLVLTFASVRVLRSMLYEVSPNDPGTLLAVAVLLAAVAAAASWGPARRAARVDPMEVMRAE